MGRTVAVWMLALALVAPGVIASQPEAEPDREEAGIEAVYCRAGKYTFWVDVRNEHFQWVNDAQATAYLQGERSARITVRADGYRDGSAYVSINPSRTTYNVRVTLRDPTVWLDVVDENRSPLQHRSRADHFGSRGDEFRFVSRISAEGFTRFGRFDVGVRINGRIPFGERVRVLDSGAERQVEVTLRRRDLRSFSNNIRVSVPSDEALPPPADDPPPADPASRYRKQAFEDLHAPAVD